MSSRLFIKNIPQNFSETSLKSMFEKFGYVTDARIQFKGEKNRRIAFVGYKNEQDASKAQKYFNNTYIQLSKISVEFAKSKEEAQNKKWVKNKGQNEQPSTDNKGDKISEIDSLKEDKKVKFKEFLNLMKGGGSKATISWNDNIVQAEEPKLQKKVKKNELIKNESQQKETKNNQKINKKNNQINNVETEQINQNLGELDEKRLYVVNLPFNCSTEEVKSVFQKYGEVLSIKMPKGKDGNFKGFAYITYQTSEEAIRAFAELDNQIVLGRFLHIKPAYQEKLEEWQIKQNEAGLNNQNQEKSSFKKLKKDNMRKKLDDQTNWNSLFLNPNAVLSVISQRFNIQKSDIFALESSDQAVKLSLAETQIINETKSWLMTQGVNMNFLENERQNVPRSDKIILIKNIPYATFEKGLKELFGQYGQLRQNFKLLNNFFQIVLNASWYYKKQTIMWLMILTLLFILVECYFGQIQFNICIQMVIIIV